MAAIDAILHNHGLRKTNFRIELLTMFLNSKSSLSVDEIKSQVCTTIDKVTIYRALDSFEKNGLIHIVPDKANLTRYALCHAECSDKGHKHNHVHFICLKCEETYCLDDIKIPEVNIPQGFHVDNSRLTLEGACVKCYEYSH